MIGKPYSGELNVRFDEGELEIGSGPLRQLSTLPIANPAGGCPIAFLWLPQLSPGPWPG